MAKALKIVGTVVAVVAIAASAVATFGASLGIAAGVVAAAGTVAAVAGVASAVVGVAAALTFKPPGFSSSGNPQDFQTNPQSGLPYAIGRTRMSGLRIHADTTDGFTGKTVNDVLGFAVLLSAGGQIGAIETFKADGETVTFDGAGNAVGRYKDYMAQRVWTGGAMASALALSLGTAAFPGWTSAHTLSGITHGLWMLRYETDGSKYGAGVPEPQWIGRWVKVYDPRLDSTYPGGSGSCRPLQEGTYIWSRNPALHALTWCLGRWQNGKRTVGIGAPLASIRVSDFVDAANVADTNGWGCGGVVYSTDSKWDVLKSMLQAGGAVPTMTGAMIGCRVFKPRISVATIQASDLLDSFSGSVTKPRRDRFNTVIPRYRSESHEWEVISAAPVTVPDWVAQDGGIRQKERDYPLVQAEVAQVGLDGDLQAGQLAAYDIANSREAGPIKWTTGPRFIGLKTGDCVTLNIPSEGFDNQPVIITSVSLEPSTCKISFTAETETDSKHAFALGKTAVPPPPFALTPPDLTPPTPEAVDWTLVPGTTNDGLPVLRLAGGANTSEWTRVIVQYRLSPSGDWISAGDYPEHGGTLIEIGGIDSEQTYVVRLAYRKGDITGAWLELPAVTALPSGIGALSGNLLQDSTFANGEAIGWVRTNVGGMDAQHGINEPGDGWHPVGENTLSIYQPNNGQSGWSDAVARINVEPLKWYEFSVLCANHRCTGRIYLEFLDAAGAVIFHDSVNVLDGPEPGGASLSDYQSVFIKRQAVAGAVTAVITLRKYPTYVGESSSWFWWLRPQIVQVTEGTPSPVPWSASGVGRKGADGISPLLVTINPPNLSLMGNATGSPMSGELPRSVAVSAMRGGLPKSITAISVTATTGCSASASGANVTFSTVNPGGGFATISVTADGETITGIKVPVTVAVGGTDASTSLALSYSGAITSSTFVALGDPVAMNANASGQLRVSASSTYYAAYPAVGTVEIKLQVSIDGGAWTDIAGASDVGDPTEVEPPSSTYPGSAVIPAVLAGGLGANKPCQVRILARKYTAANISNSSSRLLVEKP